MTLPWPSLTTEEWREAIRKDHVAKKDLTERSGSDTLSLGGPGSGNFGHAGRPGEVGGSAPGDGGGEREIGGRGSVTAGMSYRTDPTPEAFIESRNQSTRPGFLSPLDPSDLKEQRLYLSKDGTIGGAMSKDGDMGNLFNNGDLKGAAREILIDMLRDGGKTADAYDGYLPALYANFGLQETGRMKFNPEYAPPGWNYEKHDHPDVVFLARTREAAGKAGTVDDIRTRLKDEGRVVDDVWIAPDNWIVPERTAKYYDDYDEGKRDALARADASGARDLGAFREDPWGGLGGEARPVRLGRGEGPGRDVALDLGGPGSGNFGHAGRPGEVGGSAAGDGDGGDTAGTGGAQAAQSDAGGRGSGGGAVSSPAPGEGGRPPANAAAHRVANAYNETHGLPPVKHGDYVAVDDVRAGDIADAYDALPADDQHNPEVREAYEALGREVRAQWDHITASGVTMEPWTKEGQPYQTSAEMAADVRESKHLYFFSGGEPHPLLGAKTKDADGLSLNEKFRAVHDYFGHAAGGYGFGARGEENAWISHSQMLSVPARRALTTETRGQNSWVNFGRQNYHPDGTPKKLAPGDKPYATQKVALLPDKYVLLPGETTLGARSLYRDKLAWFDLGGPGSGNFGHAGRPGEVGGSASGGGGLDPSDKATWYRNGGGWNRSVDGEKPYTWRDVPEDYAPPTVEHKVLRMPGFGIWGASHGGSSMITGDAASQMGIEGYDDLGATKGASAIATRMLTEIANDATGSEEPLFHSFKNTAHTVFRPGDTMRLPLMAAAGSPQTYGVRLEHESQDGAPTIFTFPKGTPMVGYSTATKKDAVDLGHASVQDVHREFGYVWDEAIVAGGFTVERVETVYMGSQHSVHPVKHGDPIPQVYGQVVHLKPTEVYDPATKTWRPRG